MKFDVEIQLPRQTGNMREMTPALSNLPGPYISVECNNEIMRKVKLYISSQFLF